MIFADLFFVFVFLPCFFAFYLIAGLLEKKSGTTILKNGILLLFSLIFYAWGEPVYILLLIFGVLLTWAAGRFKFGVAGIIYHILVMVFFKYGNLIQSSLLSAGLSFTPIDLHLPIGISFYSFQCISYLADVRSGRSEARKNPLGVLLYISMFPQLIAGPIVRYNTVAGELSSRKVSSDDIAEGLRRFAFGLAKKVLLADQLALIVSDTMGKGGDVGIATAWLGLIAFSMQIYFDFSGYSDMAIGMGRMMGFHFNENFDDPYMCSSVPDFWRRWHMSLGQFFRDYVYIPMGGNRKGAFRFIFNVLIVWTLTGAWHGGSLNYILWGFYFALLLLMDRLIFGRKDKEHNIAVRFIRRILSLFAVIFGWCIFYFEDLKTGLVYVRSLFMPAGGEDVVFMSLLKQNLFLLIAALILCLPLKKLFKKRYAVPEAVFTAVIFVLSVIMLIGESNHPFLYTRF
ncbi:MAG: MBOAT family protein [Lachnospiraceae bacterium]|nr:MBOAT family protein [Lachnospiraceae bacterium]